MTKLTKEQRERSIFENFASNSGLKIDMTSIQSCEPPFPDIACNLDGMPYFFELTEIVPRDQAKALGDFEVSSHGVPDPNDSCLQAMLHSLSEKQQKNYTTNGASVDLVLYFNMTFPIDLPNPWNDGGLNSAVAACKNTGKFERIWTYCTWTGNCECLA